MIKKMLFITLKTKKYISAVIFTSLICIVFSSCSSAEDALSSEIASLEISGASSQTGSSSVSDTGENANISGDSSDETLISIEVVIDGRVFPAKFYNNESAHALIEQMPVTFDMAEMNSNEKYIWLDENLPYGDTERPSTIQAGEIMCWTPNCLVLFYETFSNFYDGYVRLGYIEDIAGLTEALGAENVAVTFRQSE